jgi:hypothetical protein
MEIKLTKHWSPSKEFPGGQTNYYLNGLENPSDLDSIVSVLRSDFQVKIVRDMFGIWFRRVELEKEGKEIILYWDEDLDVFFVDGAKTKDAWLENLIKDSIPLIENYINQKK